jgi:hypothetical protein
MKKMLQFFALVILSGNLLAQAGPSSPATLTTAAIAGSSANWANAGNAALSDDVYTNHGDITGAIGSYTDYLVATNFGFAVPGGATITGIEVSIERADPNGRTSDYSIRIIKGGVISTTEMSLGSAYPGTDTYMIYGDPFTSWGETWTDADVNAADFGVAIAAQRSALGGSTAGVVDNILITVYYSAVLPVKLVNFSVAKKENAVEVKWVVEDESDLSHYEVEKSANAHDFTSISNVSSRNQTIRSTYTSTDYKPLNGTSYYRLKSVDISGKIYYSKVVMLNFNKDQSISIYPTKIKAGTALHVTNTANETLTVYFYTAAGKLLGKARTESNEIQTSFLSNTVGMLFYKIVKENGVTAGSGTLIAN